MSIFGNMRSNVAAGRLAEETLYASVLREVEAGYRRDGIWAKALSEAGMDETRATAIYIKLRVQSLKDEMALRPEPVRQTVPTISVNADQESRHPGCGGVVTREEYGSTVKWRCRSCGKRGQFTRGRDYTVEPLDKGK